MLRMVDGLEEITAGEVRFGERVANRLEPRDRDIAMVLHWFGAGTQRRLEPVAQQPQPVAVSCA